MVEIKRMKELADKAKDVIAGIVGKQVVSIVGATEDKGKWTVTVQALERKAVPDSQNLIGVYDVTLTERGDVLGYKQTELRHLGDTKAPPEEE